MRCKRSLEFPEAFGAPFNTALLRTAVEFTPAGQELRIESIEAINLYNGDVEATEGIRNASAM